MQEYILYSQIPCEREKQVLAILAGLTGVQPVPIHEQVLIYAQVKAPVVAVSKKVKPKPQQNEGQGLSYHKLWREVITKEDDTQEVGDWKFRAEQTPEAGSMTLISRGVVEHKATEAELERLKQPEWYQFRRHYANSGDRFIFGNVIIRIYRMVVPMEEGVNEGLIEATPLPIEGMKLVDASGSLIVESLVRVATPDKTNNIEDQARKDKPSVTDSAKEELMKFRARMDGAVDLYAPDRLALDTRARNV
ncbi:hypothetical protein DOTSEDRAFT_29570 [Dothistroma septosporum NZE10]|uniref:Mediator of RNA polymerase II transcription subunit 18 n=1 Tax=Dothistroma septosporum (strain NZE10 / CBS 128990) TaxID=675120 RepID=N1PDL5_DOTSN|nr:hypothetical protein DOTSEDRAFT_29570 [Dothistroma septosporum NZE10]